MPRRTEPEIKIEETPYHFDIRYAVWHGSTQVAYCDTRTRAEFLVRALKAWHKTEDYQEWKGNL